MAYIKSIIHGFVLGAVLLFVVGCEIGPQDKFVITFTDTATVMYYPSDTNPVLPYALVDTFTEDTTLTLRNRPDHKTFAYLADEGRTLQEASTGDGISDQAARNRDGIWRLTIVPGQDRDYFRNLLNWHNNDGSDANMQRADENAVQHARQSDYRLDNSNNPRHQDLQLYKVDSIWSIRLEGKFIRMQLMRSNGQVVDYMGWLPQDLRQHNFSPPREPTPTQAVSAEPGQPLTLEFKKVSPETEVAGTYQAISNNCEDDGGPITITQNERILQFANGFGYDCDCNYEGTIDGSGFIVFSNQGACSECSQPPSPNTQESTASCRGWVVDGNLYGVCDVTGSQTEVCTFDYQRAPAAPPVLNR